MDEIRINLSPERVKGAFGDPIDLHEWPRDQTVALLGWDTWRMKLKEYQEGARRIIEARLAEFADYMPNKRVVLLVVWSDPFLLSTIQYWLEARNIPSTVILRTPAYVDGKTFDWNKCSDMTAYGR